MRLYFIFLSTLLLLFGCSSKEHEQLDARFEKNQSYYKRLQKTEKVQLYDGEDTKAVLTATYLYTQNDDLKDSRKEVFVVGVYIQGDPHNRFGNEYNLTLASKEPLSIELLSPKSDLLKDISFKKEWSSYYLVTFPHISEKSFHLVFASKHYGKEKMYFAKVAKYVISKKGF